MRHPGHEVREHSQGHANNLKGATYELIVATKLNSDHIGLPGDPIEMLMTSRLIRTTALETGEKLTTDLDVVYKTANGLTEFVQCKATQSAPSLTQLQDWARKAVAYAKAENIPLNTVRIRLVTETGLSPTNQVKWIEFTQQLPKMDVAPDIDDIMTVLPVAW